MFQPPRRSSETACEREMKRHSSQIFIRPRLAADIVAYAARFAKQRLRCNFYENKEISQERDHTGETADVKKPQLGFVN